MDKLTIFVVGYVMVWFALLSEPILNLNCSLFQFTQVYHVIKLVELGK